MIEMKNAYSVGNGSDVVAKNLVRVIWRCLRLFLVSKVVFGVEKG